MATYPIRSVLIRAGCRAGIAIVLSAAVAAAQQPPIRAELVDVRKIWDRAPHNAFTDLVRYQGKFFVTFREAKSHSVKPPGSKIRVLVSDDGEHWASAALLAYRNERYDLRDSKLSVTPDGRLMLNTAVVPPENRHARQSLAWFSNDGSTWQGPVPVGEPNWWLWRVAWHPDGTVYGLAYGDITKHPRTTRLYRSRDGRSYETLVPKLTSQPETGESAMLFRPDGTAVVLVRRDGKEPNAMVGVSAPNDYTRWTFRELGLRVGGPAILQLPAGPIVAATRLHDGKVRTSLSWLDPEGGKLVELLRLPSGGDTSYPGLLWHNDLLWMSYYSSHEGKTSIYLAKIRIQFCPAAAPEKPSATPGASAG